MLLKCAILEFASTSGWAEGACLRAILSAKLEGKCRVEVSAESRCGCGRKNRGKRIGAEEFGRGWGKYRTSDL